MSSLITKVEASLMRFLYESVEVTHNIPVFEDVLSTNFDSHTEWVVIESLSNQLGPQPKQLYFIHAATQNGAPRAKERLNSLIDLLTTLLEEGTQITLYDYPSDTKIGYLEVCETSLSPVLTHRGGGNMRTVQIGIVY